MAALVPLGQERALYLQQNARWGRENVAANEGEAADVEATLRAVESLLAERPGRTAAGKDATWGRSFRVGSTPFYALLSRRHLDQVSFLYHSMSLTSDIMVLRNEESAVDDAAFGVRRWWRRASG